MLILAYIGLGLALTFALFGIAYRADQRDKEALERAKREEIERGDSVTS